MCEVRRDFCYFDFIVLSCASVRREFIWFSVKSFSNLSLIRYQIQQLLCTFVRFKPFIIPLKISQLWNHFISHVQNIVSITPPDSNNNASKFCLSTQAPVRLVLLELSVIIRMIFGNGVFFPSINLLPGNVVFQTFVFSTHAPFEIARWRAGIFDQYFLHALRWILFLDKILFQTLRQWRFSKIH